MKKLGFLVSTLFFASGPTMALTDGLASDKLVSFVSCKVSTCENGTKQKCFIVQAKIESAITRSYDLITSKPSTFTPSAKYLCEEVNSRLASKNNYRRYKMISALLYSNKWTNPEPFTGIEFLSDVLNAEKETEKIYQEKVEAYRTPSPGTTLGASQR